MRLGGAAPRQYDLILPQFVPATNLSRRRQLRLQFRRRLGGAGPILNPAIIQQGVSPVQHALAQRGGDLPGLAQTVRVGGTDVVAPLRVSLPRLGI